MLLESERETAGQIQAALAIELTRIRAVQGLTQREQQRQKARAVLAARGQLRELRIASEAREADDRQRAFIAAFGIDPTRSAEERSLRRDITDAAPGAVETERLMAESLRIGDILGAKVVASYAWDHRNDQLGGDTFRSALDAYAGHSDGLTRIMQNLADSDVTVGSSGTAKLARLQEKLLTEVPTPHDLPGNIDWLAADDEPSGQNPMGMPFTA